MKSFKFLCFIFISLVCIRSQASEYSINSDHSDLQFSIKYLGLSKVRGKFKKFSGIATYENKALRAVEIEIDIKSIDTGNKKRDGHLRRSDFFNVKKFKTAKFVSERVEKGPNGVDIVYGYLSLKGTKKSISLKVKNLGERSDTWSKESIFLEFQTSLNRMDFGINWNKTLDKGGVLLSDIVSVYGNIQLQKIGSKTDSLKYLIPDTASIREREKYSRGEIAKLSKKEIIISETDKLLAEKPMKITNTKNTPPPAYRSYENLFLMKFFIGFFGFVGAIFLAINAKFLTLKILKIEQYDESQSKSLIGDVVSVLVILPYFYYFYELVSL